jgi:hypothetical protein
MAQAFENDVLIEIIRMMQAFEWRRDEWSLFCSDALQWAPEFWRYGRYESRGNIDRSWFCG